MLLIEDVAPSIWENERMLTSSIPPPLPLLFFIFAKPQNVPFLLALMHLLITKFLSKHLLWIRWITHSFYHAPPPHARMQYVAVTVMSCEIEWEGWSAVL